MSAHLLAVRSVRRCSVLLNHLKGTSRTRMLSSSSVKEDEVLFSTVYPKEDTGDRGGFRLIRLNRPKALNALNLNMIRLIDGDMKRGKDISAPVVVMEGAGDKAFCAGGDIRAVTEAGKAGDPLAQEFFVGEYSLNHFIGTYNKTFVAIIDGITMGGGVGLSVHSPFRVATQHTLFAMPETFIGLFPDVGGSHFLPRLCGSLGMFLALTGHRLKGRDVQYAGVATHYVVREKIPELYEEIAVKCGQLHHNDLAENNKAVKEILDDFHEQCSAVDSNGFKLKPYLEQINNCYDKDSVEGILAALEADGTAWGKEQLKTLSVMSPTAMKVTHHQLKLGAKLSFADCFKMEYRMSQAAMAGHDFYEGVRAVIVDKDNSPKWNPPTLAEVTPEMVQRYFDPLPDELELKL